MMYENKDEEKVKVPVEGTKPKQYKTLYKGDKIEVESSVYAKCYEANGLSLVEEKKKQENKASKPKIEKKAVESKAGEKVVETKVLKE